MIPGPEWEDLLRRGQLPVFVPNYYRGALRQLPDASGRSSQLINTGTVSWVYRIVIEDLFGLRGCRQGLRIRPCLPSHWNRACVQRDFRGAHFRLQFERGEQAAETIIRVNGRELAGEIIGDIVPGARYEVTVTLGAVQP
jgi:cellobionic acid phosphorylase